MMLRGQVVLVDTLTAFVIFILIVDASILFWESETARVGYSQSMGWNEEVARAASSQLLTPGSPSNWEFINLNSSSFHSFGLTSSENVIDSGKLQTLESLKGDPANYQIVKKGLGLDCCKMWFGVLYPNGTLIESYGNAPTSNSSSVSIDRVAVLNSSPVIVRLKVW
jgi:hypothetical protein